MKRIVTCFVLLLAVACSTEEVQEGTPVVEENLVEIKDGMYREYYPGKKQVKFQGEQDENQLRHNKWTFYSEDGKELSVTFFNHGIKEGHTIVKYPNGTLHYIGEYHLDKPVGVWQTYDQQGNMVSEKDYGYPEE